MLSCVSSSLYAIPCYCNDNPTFDLSSLSQIDAGLCCETRIEFPNQECTKMPKLSKPIDPQRINESQVMLKQYLDDEPLAPLLGVLNEMAEHPEDEALLGRLSDTVDNLGIMQGAVLTYAPYIALVLSEYRFIDIDMDID